MSTTNEFRALRAIVSVFSRLPEPSKRWLVARLQADLAHAQR